MLDPRTLKISQHFMDERLDRYAIIQTTVGIGNVLYSFYAEGTYSYNHEHLTDTGICLVTDLNDETLITAFPLTIDKALAVSKANNFKLPKTYLNTIKRTRRILEKAGID